MVRQDFYDQLEVSNAGREYLALVESCASRILTSEPGYEIHHIQPTCLGGLNVNDNKVKFTVFEHCKAHALLAQAIPCYKTLQPLVKMSYGQISKISDLEKIELDEIYRWTELREKALHHPKSPEHIEKNRQSHLKLHFKPSQEHLKKMHQGGKVAVNDGNVCHLVSLENLPKYLEQGWTRGRTPATKQRLSNSHKGVISPSQGRKCITKDGKELKVNVSELDKYLAEGWKLGRDQSFNQKRQKYFIERGDQTGLRVRINKDGVNRLVLKTELDDYLLDGWKIGMFKKTIPND